ncbi:hypothetical protein [Roseivirga sp.]|uniref:hypothetical protein n=1 Tax=Roseivirga sp. TaxID=1964215 RepID=UPI002B26FE16|nr:hypothetical protein [Roseivirga sp.]
MEALKKFLEFELFHIGEFQLRVLSLVIIFIIFLVTKLVLLLIKKTIFSRENSKLDIGASYALFKIIKYVIWVIAIGLILEALSVKLTVLIAGSAALLVGVGLGLNRHSTISYLGSSCFEKSLLKLKKS